MIKIVVVGFGAAGKSCMSMSYRDKQFPRDVIPTVFSNDIAFGVEVGGKNYTIGIFDTAGQEDYDRLRPLSYPQTDVFLVCFRVDNYDSFDTVPYKWVPEITHYCPGTPFILVGTQVDLREDSETIERLARDGQKPVTEEMGINLAKQVNAVKYLECSALTQIGLHDVFSEAVKVALNSEQASLTKKTCCLLL